MKNLIFPILLSIVMITPYCINVYKFVNCDFESDYKCEAIHGIGTVIPPAAFITAWFASDSE